MRQFLITSQAYNGEATVLYDETGRLVKVDVMETNMPPAIIKIFKEKLPVFVDDLATAFKDTVTVVETSFEVTFDMWWKAYDKKINKARCIPLWSKLSTADQVKAFIGVKGYDSYLRSLPYQRPKADPEKYLKDKYWENEWK